MDLWQVWNFWHLYMYCFVSSSVYFYVAGVYKGNYFAVPVNNVVLGSAATCPVVYGFPGHSLKTPEMVLSWHFLSLWGCCLFNIFTTSVLLKLSLIMSTVKPLYTNPLINQKFCQNQTIFKVPLYQFKFILKLFNTCLKWTNFTV